MNTMRRKLCQSLAALLGPLGLGACSQPAPQKPQRTYTAQEQQLLDKFRGISGYDLTVGLYPKRLPTSRGLYLKVVDDRGAYVAGGVGIHTSQAGLPPITIHAELYDDTNANWKDKQPERIGKWTVPVAERIPEDLLDDLRRDPKGSLRIKIRLHRDGVMLGWDIERRPGFDPRKRDKFGEAVYVAPVHSFAGGDFREARIFNGKPERMGWYIDPKTGRKTETDF